MVDVSDETIELPPGFRFHPTDEEIITHYLSHKVVKSSFTARAIGEVDLNKCEPWDLPKKATMGEKEWYFFCQRDRKYPTGMRTNRATEAGYWKATGKDKEIYKGRNCLVGMKKTLVFYRGRAPKGEKTNWVMHEYRLEGKFSGHNLPRTAKDEWVVCRVFHKSSGIKKAPMVSGFLGMNSFGDEPSFDDPSLPPLLDSPYIHNTGRSEDTDNKGFTFSNNYAINTYPPQVQYQNPTFTFQGGTSMNSSSGFLHPHMNNTDFNNNPRHQDILRALASNVRYEHHDTNRQCKVEQFSSNQSMVSQDTGLSTEISSGGNNRGYDDFEAPSSSGVGQVVDLETLWNY